jgi:hypothetical protein
VATSGSNVGEDVFQENGVERRRLAVIEWRDEARLGATRD